MSLGKEKRQIKDYWELGGGGVSVLIRVVILGLTEKLAFRPRLKGSEGLMPEDLGSMLIT